MNEFRTTVELLTGFGDVTAGAGLVGTIGDVALSAGGTGLGFFRMLANQSGVSFVCSSGLGGSSFFCDVRLRFFNQAGFSPGLSAALAPGMGMTWIPLGASFFGATWGGEAGSGSGLGLSGSLSTSGGTEAASSAASFA